MSAESGLPPVDPEVLDRACDAAWKACWPEFPHRPGSTGDRHIRRALESAGPIVAAAAYRQGREGLEARIEAKARELDGMAQAQADEFGNYITSAGRSGEYKEGRADAYDDAAESLRSLLTDKDGE